MTRPAISVVMSVFNGGAFLSEAVESILGQTFTDFEFIIIDDGSTDRTAEILADFARRDARIRIHRHANRGRTASLNVGMDLAQGRYIARMDADDVAVHDRFERQFEFLETHPEVGLLGGAVEMMGPNGQALRVVIPPMDDPEIRAAMVAHNVMWHPAVMMRKDVVAATGGYRPAFDETEDYDLWLRIGEIAKIANLGGVVLRYRIHPNQASVRKLTHQMECLLAAQAAASLRQRGLTDPFFETKDVTPELLHRVGVKGEDIRRYVIDAHNTWIGLLFPISDPATLELIDQLLGLCEPVLDERRYVVASALFTATRIHYRARHYAKALACAGRAVLAQPSVVVTFLKLAAARRLNGRAAVSEGRKISLN